MTVTVSFSDASDGYLDSAGGAVNPYSGALTGPADAVDTAGTSALWGQSNPSAGEFHVFQAFFRFPYTLDGDSVITAAEFKFVSNGSNSTGVNRDLEVREFDWGTSLTTADWRTPTQLNALTLLGSIATAQTATNAFHIRAASAALLSRLVFTGEVRVVVCSSRNRNQNQPSSDESSSIRTSNFSGTTEDPALVYTTAPISDLFGVLGAQVQLSDGTHAFLELDADNFTGVDNILLRHHNGTSVSDIATIATEDDGGASNVFRHPENLGAQAMALVADASDNLYVIGPRNNATNFVAARAYTKGVGYSWSAGTLRAEAMPAYAGAINNVAAAWHNEGIGGTIVVVVQHASAGGSGVTGVSISGSSSYALLNCNFLLTAAGSLLRASGDTNGVLIDTASSSTRKYVNQTGTLLDVCAAPGSTNRGFVLSMLQAVDLGSVSNVSIARYQLASGGASFADTTRERGAGALASKDATAKLRVLGIGTSQFVTVSADDSVFNQGLTVIHWQNIGTSSTFAQLSSVELAEEGITSMPDPAALAVANNWDAVYDPITNKVAVYYFDQADIRRLMRTGVDLNTGQADLAEIEVQAAVGAVGSTNHAIRVHRGATTGGQVLISVANEASGAHSTLYVTDSLNAPPTQPTLTPKANFDGTDPATFVWTFNDPNPGDTQSAYQLQIDQVGGPNVFDSGKTPSGVSSHLLTAATLTNGVDYQWRVKTWDSQDEESPFSNFSNFTTGASGTVTIIDPAVDNPAGVITSDYLIEWEVAGTVQADYRVRLIRTDTMAVLSDTGFVTSAATTHLVENMLSGVEHRVEVTVRDAVEVQTNTATRLITPEFGQPEQPPVTVEEMPDAGHILISVTNPPPEGDRPEVVTNVILRRVAGSGVDYEPVGDAPPDGSLADYTATAGIVYEYVARGVAADGSFTDSDPVQGGPLNLLGVWLHDPVDPAGTVAQFLHGKALRSSQVDTMGTEQLFAGREFPVVDYGEHQQNTYQVQVQVLEGPDLQSRVATLTGFAGAKRTLVFRDNRGRVMFGAMSGFNTADAPWGSAVSFTFTRVDAGVGDF